MKLSKSLRIGEVSKLTQISVETLRFYETKGLLSPSKKPTTGYRYYSQESVNKLSFIAKAKTLGFSLSEISELLAFANEVESDCEKVKTGVENKIAEVQAKITSLQDLEASLQVLNKVCDGKDPIQKCPIINSLKGELHDLDS